MGWKIGDKITVDPKDTDLVLIEQDGNTRNTTWAKLKAFFLGTAKLTTTEQTIKGAINEIKASTDANATSLSDMAQDISDLDTNKANNTDNTRTTTAKTATGAINELNSGKAPLASPAFTGTPKANGYNLLEAVSSGYKVQTGVTSATITIEGSYIDVTVTFPIAFVNTPNVVASIAGATAGESGYLNVRVSRVSATSVTFRCNSYVAQILAFNWLAIGN